MVTRVERGERYGDGVVLTKLAPPRRAGYVVPRDRLTLEFEAPSARIVAVTAGAGWGKTTLVGQWAEAVERPVAWLSVDDGDQDPGRFWTHLLAALGDATDGRLTVTPPRPSDIRSVLVPRIVNELARLDTPLGIVLDDYHLVTGSAVDGQLEALIERCPPAVVLVIAGRTEPKLPLARWRARGELREIRSAELRFRPEEAQTFLNDGLALGLSAAAVDGLVSRTEGWIAGIYLAALAADHHADRAMPAFSADHRFVMDYLASEVVDQVPGDVRELMLRTSVPDYVSGSLARALTGRADAAAVLATLERTSQFVTTVDAGGRWFRYHRLLRDMLRQQLADRDPDLLAQMRQMTGEWYRQEGSPAEAICYLVAAGAHAEAGSLIKRHWFPIAANGSIASVDRWIHALPDHLVQQDPALSVIGAWAALNLDRYDEVETYLSQATALAPGDFLLSDRTPVGSSAAAIRAHVARHLGDADTSCRQAATALDECTSLAPGTASHAACLTVAGVAHFWMGHDEQAEALLVEAVATARARSEWVSAVQAGAHLAAIYAERGRHRRAEEEARDALALIDRHNLHAYDQAGPIHLALGLGQMHAGRHDSARAELDAAYQLANRGREPLEAIRSLLALADLAVAEGHAHAAREALDDARLLLHRCPNPGFLAVLYEKTAIDVLAMPAERNQRSRDLVEPLTARELAVLRLLNSQLTLQEIGRELRVSYNTVKTHAKAVYRKLGATSRREALDRARQLSIR